jgi:hypothetical protein
MTVAVGTRLSSAGDGTTTVFSPTFRANSAAELDVVVVTDSDGTKTDQVLNTDYTVTFASGLAGVPTITFTTAPAASTTVIITPAPDYEQAQAVSDTTPLFGSTVEAALDAMAAQIQALADRYGNTFRASNDDGAINAIGDWKDRLDMYLYFNATTGQPEAKTLAAIQVDLGTLDADLGDIASLTPSDDDILQRKSSAWTNRTPTQVASDLGTVLPDGTVSLPGIAFAADPDTGLYRIGTNNIGLATAGAKALDVNANGQVIMPLSSAFLAYAASDITNVTGAGTAYVMQYGTEVHDRNADYDTATGIFTSEVADLYDFSGSITVLELGAATSILVELVTTNRTYQLINIAGADDVSNTTTLNWSVVGADMDAAETAKVQLTIGGITDVVDIDGDASMKTWFSGRLVA